MITTGRYTALRGALRNALRWAWLLSHSHINTASLASLAYPPPSPQERAQDALAIARAAAELSHVVADVHGLVHTQEESINAVETKTSSALTHTENAVKELEIAKSHVSSYRRKWACVALVVILGIAVILILHFAVPAGMPGHI